MQKVLTAAEMREVDRLTTERYGIPSILLMENAAHAVARVITDRLGGSADGRCISILCGKGNNGGDGAALARVLWTLGFVVKIFFFGKTEETHADAKLNFEILNKLNIEELYENFITFYEIDKCKGEFSTQFLNGSNVIVDALFGTGLSRPLEGEFENLVKAINRFRKQNDDAYIVSLDIASGLNADEGDLIGENIQADLTITFTAPKIASVLPPASNFAGELVIAAIGSPIELIYEVPSELFVAERIDVEQWLLDANFSDDSYKNRRGHTLLIAGSDSFSGAAVLTGNSAMRSGVGLVTIATPKSSKDSVASRVLPEVIVRGVAETESGAMSVEAFDAIGDLLEKADAVSIGCGLSQDESTKEFVKKVVEKRRQPTIVDADALNLLSPCAAQRANGESDVPLILTPHEGEFMRLLGTEDKEAIKDRVASVREFSQKNNVILVLKGERVLIGEPGGKVVVNPTGNSGLGKAGNGDTLTGIIAGFAAQAVQMKIDMFETVVAAVYVAGMAGDIAEKKYGKRVMTASDVRECLSEVFEMLDSEG